MRFLRSLWETSELKWILGLGEPSKDHTRHKANIQYRSNIHIFDIFVVKKKVKPPIFSRITYTSKPPFFSRTGSISIATARSWKHRSFNLSWRWQKLWCNPWRCGTTWAARSNVGISRRCGSCWCSRFICFQKVKVLKVFNFETGICFEVMISQFPMVSLQKVGFTNKLRFKRERWFFRWFLRNSRWTRPASLAIIAPEQPPRWRRQQRGGPALLALCRGGWYPLFPKIGVS